MTRSSAGRHFCDEVTEVVQRSPYKSMVYIEPPRDFGGNAVQSHTFTSYS